MPEEKKEGTNKKRSIWGWIFGIIYLLIGFLFLFSSFLAGLLLILSTLFFFPPAVKLIQKKWKFELSKKLKIVTAIVGVALFFILIGGGDTEKAEIKIEKGDSEPEEMIEAGQLLTDVTADYQDAQLSTVALLSVKFETADKEDYLKYIKEVQEKWEKVEKSAKKLEKIKDKEAKIPLTLKKDSLLFSTSHAAYPEEIEFNDALGSDTDFGSGEISVGNLEGQVFEGNIFKEARAFKYLYPNKTSIEHLMEHFDVTAEEANKLLADYYKTVGSSWNDSAAIYDAASKTAQGIAYGSKVSLYVLGTVASFGAAAAAQTGTGVIMGYMGGAWGAAVGGADIALDVAEGASVVSTGKGLVNYKKDKEFLGKVNNTLIIFNVAKIGATGIPTFDGTSFQMADDFMSIFTPVEAGVNHILNPGENKVKAQWGKGVKFPKGTPIDEIIKAYHKEGFDYNKVAISITQDEKSGEVIAQEVGVASNDDNCQPDRDTRDPGNGKLIQESYWWPACGESVFSGPSCQHLPNTCLFQGRCVCAEGYIPTTNEDKKALTCITDEEQMLLLGDQLARVHVAQCEGVKDHPACNNSSYKKSAEVEALEKRLENEEMRSKKAWRCDL